MPIRSLSFTPARAVSAVDTLVAGDVLRIVLDGAPKLRATSPFDALRELRAEHQDFRRFIIDPPRGHDGIDACILLSPFSSDAVRTAIIAEHFGYAPVAGTLLLASAVVLIETGEVAAREPTTSVVFDTAKGKAEVVVTVASKRCVSSKWTTERPRVISRKQRLTLAGERTISAALINSGLPYVVACAADLDVDFRDERKLGAAGAMLSSAAGQQMPLQGLGMEQDADAYLVMLVGDLTDHGAAQAAQVQAAFISPTGSVARMPTGTGTLSVGAYFNEKRRLPYSRALDVTSPTGHRLRCQVEETKASVEGAVRIISLVDLVADPLA